MVPTPSGLGSHSLQAHPSQGGGRRGVPPSGHSPCAKLLTVLRVRFTPPALARPTPDLSSHLLPSVTSTPGASPVLRKHATPVLPQGLCTACSSCPEHASSRSCLGSSSKVTSPERPSLTPSSGSVSPSCLISSTGGFVGMSSYPPGVASASPGVWSLRWRSRRLAQCWI